MSTRQIEVFFSYSHKDESLRDELDAHLSALKHQDKISNWHDRKILPGDEWANAIDARLEAADLILLLISADFLASKYCNIELQHALERQQAGEARVIPIILRPVDWQGSPLEKLQGLPTNFKPVTEWDDRDVAFRDVAKGIRAAVDQLAATPLKPKAPTLPPQLTVLSRPVIGFVRRHDAEGNDILAQLQQLLAPGQRQLVTLHGSGGVGKTTLAVEAVLALAGAFGNRVVWTGPERRADFGLGTLLDEVATQLGAPELRQLALAPKQEAVAALLVAAPALVVLDNFETLGDGKAKADAEAEQQACSGWLREAPCAALITSRDNVAGARNLRIHALAPEEAREFLERLIKEDVQFPAVFTAEVREQISSAAEANPLLMQWIVGQIDDAREPQTVLDELRRGVGSAAERVFDRSFRLAQLGDEGRAVLLALALFVPDAGRDALAEVAGLGDARTRFDEAVTRLVRLWLAKPKEANQRLAVEGLTRQLALARLGHRPDGEAFRRRFVAHLLAYAVAHAETTPEDFAALEREKDSLLAAMDLAFQAKDWDVVVRIHLAVERFLDLRGYWGEIVQTSEKALEAARLRQDEMGMAHFTENIAIMHQNLGHLEEARHFHDQSLEIKKKLKDQRGIAKTYRQLGKIEQLQSNWEEAGKLYNHSLEISIGIDDQLAVASTCHQLGMIAQYKGEWPEAHRLYEQSLEIRTRLKDRVGIAATLHQLGKLATQQGRQIEARQLYCRSLKIKRQLGDQRGIAVTIHHSGWLAQTEGNLMKARRRYEKSLKISEALGDQRAIASTLLQLGIIAQAEGKIVEAKQHYDKSYAINKGLGTQRGIARNLECLGNLAHAQGDLVKAQRLYQDALRSFERLNLPDAEQVREALTRVEKELEFRRESEGVEMKDVTVFVEQLREQQMRTPEGRQQTPEEFLRWVESDD